MYISLLQTYFLHNIIFEIFVNKVRTNLIFKVCFDISKSVTAFIKAVLWQKHESFKIK